MTRLIHLTDLHFGQDHAEMVAPLTYAIQGLAKDGGVDLVVVSGDLTHRARGAQFAQAMAFIRGLSLPYLCVPGNHDMPLYNVALRFTQPFWAYRRHVGADLAPSIRAGGATLLSANTGDPFSWRRGVLRGDDQIRILTGLKAAPAGDMRILVCHHPLTEPPGFQRGETRNAVPALQAFADAGLDIVLSGHLHHWSVGLGVTVDDPRPILQVQTGTALCARLGEAGHGFAVLEFQDRSAVSVTQMMWSAEGRIYAPGPRHHFRRGLKGWLATPEGAQS